MKNRYEESARRNARQLAKMTRSERLTVYAVWVVGGSVEHALWTWAICGLAHAALGITLPFWPTLGLFWGGWTLWRMWRMRTR